MQAIEDLFVYPKSKKGKNPPLIQITNCKRIRDLARAFLFNNSPVMTRDRNMVFELAGINPEVNLKGLRKESDAFESIHAA